MRLMNYRNQDSDDDSESSNNGDHSMSFEEAMNEIEMVARLDHPNSELHNI